MPDKKFKPVKANDPVSAAQYNELLRVVEQLDGFGFGSGISSVRGSKYSAGRVAPGARIKFIRLDAPIGVESSSAFRDRSGTVVYYDESDGLWKDSDETAENICSPYGDIVFDGGQIVACLDHWNGKLVPLSYSTVRHAVTSRGSGSYPSRTSEPNVYPIKFCTVTYTESAGHQTPSITNLDSDSEADDFVLNIVEETDHGPVFIPEGTLLQVYSCNNQWFTHVCCEFPDSSSSLSNSFSSLSASSASESSTSTSSTSASSQSASSGSSSQGSSISISFSSMSASSISRSESSKSASSLSASSLSASSQSLSSGGSSASSDVSSGGSSASSSVSVSDSSGYDCIDVVTSLSFDPETCLLSYCTKTICFPKSLGIIIGDEQC
jgi:hypothetical protein